jgi:biotin carboxyl carrier protein
MKNYNITVNGKLYQVQVEEVGSNNAQAYVAPTQAAPVKQATSVAAPVEKPVAAPTQSTPKKEVPSGGENILAPMPGTILDIKVKEGDMVREGQVLVILEAMKMENEIMAPSDMKVISIITTKGASVNSGDVLVVLG